MSHRPNTPLLDRVQLPEDLKRFSDAELSQVAEELRQEPFQRFLKRVDIWAQDWALLN